MSGMHWEKRNREAKQFNRHGQVLRRPPGWKDRPAPISFSKWPVNVAPHDNAGPAVRAARKARITLPAVSILK